MRLIDADALPRQKMLEACGNGKYEDVDIVYGVDVDAAPTIDAVPMDDYMNLHNHFVDWEPVRHGKWVVAGDTTHYYICSVCGEPGDCWDNYCRSCGSRMEGAEDD